MGKLIILRGNSGSGKTTVAKELQKKFGYNTMPISQDEIRRNILWVKDGIDTKALPLMIELLKYGYEHSDIVILEGIMHEETISYWFELPIDIAEFEEKLGVGAESGDYRIIEKVLPFADEVHEHTSVYQLNELDFMYRQLSSDMQEEYVSLLTIYENLEALYICRNVIMVYPDCKSMIDVARQKLMNDPTFKHLSEDCQEYYFDFEAYASHLQEHGKFLVTEHGIFELPE